LNDENFQLDGAGKYGTMYLVDIDDDPNFNPGVTYPGIEPPIEDYGDMAIEEDDDKEAIDMYLNAELILGVGTNDKRRGRVIKQTLGLDGKPIGRSHTNPFFDTLE
jgi:hypothetical protein